ncbi:MAG: threonine synthase [Rhodospirillales bacterium]|nr:threonine synthase [Rhodospirillales bacterium]
MNYVSTRGSAPVLEFDEVLLAGLARDGGLYVPESWPVFDADKIRSLKNLSYPELAFEIIKPFVGNTVSDKDLKAILDGAYAHFDTAEVAPLKKLDTDEYLLELFHGPTIAFKDMAMQFLGPMFDHVLRKRQQRVTIVGATSGDTGSAAIEACRDRAAIDIFILYPHGRVSDVQRKQMTTVMAANVHCIAVKGTFDDCQDMVKNLFNDTDFRDRWNLSAVNSINWARIVAQIVYYFWAALKVGSPDKAVSFAVPTGNFGNVFAGYAARKMGLPIERLVIGSNSNDILTRFFETGTMEMNGVHPTISPSMDIQVSSNFERLLFDLFDRDGAAVKRCIDGFRETGKFSVSPQQFDAARQLFEGYRFDDAETKAMIALIYKETGELLDPHSAVGVAAARRAKPHIRTPLVALATAHPAKFPDAVAAASGQHPALPAHLTDLFDRKEKSDVIDNDLDKVRSHIIKTLEGTA